MRRLWIGVALLSGSWLLGTGFYEPARPGAWAVAMLLGAGFLWGAAPIPSRRTSLTAAAMLVPAAVVFPWPYRAAFVAMVTGLAAACLPRPRPSRSGFGGAAIASGAILGAQGVALLGYAVVTSRSHDAPPWVASVLAALARLAGADAASTGTNVAIGTMRATHMLGATWDFVLDPASISLVLGGLVLLALCADQSTRPWRAWSDRAARLLLILVGWLPLRATLLIAVFVHRALRTDYDEPLGLTNQFWSAWVHLLLLFPPALLAGHFVRIPAAPAGTASVGQCAFWRAGVALAAAVCAGIAFVGAVIWDPAGQGKAGRVLVDEFHSQWERTDRPYDTEWYGHESGYNYACIYDYCSRFFEMGRLEAPITDESLAGCDVLVLKTPTKTFRAPERRGEVDAIVRFVDRGGGLLLIGEHTNVFGTGTYLNEVAERFGFRFRYDCLFGIDSPFEQLYSPGVFAHPVVQHVPPMDFAVSCSIDPGHSRGRAVIRSAGLKSVPADYHASNFYPQVEDRPDARYGAFIQLWAVRHGEGRVLAFTDSTIFSNFSAFEPGKAELMLGMLQWLNHRDTLPDLRAGLAIIGLLAGSVSVLVGRSRPGPWLLPAAGAAFGLAAGGVAVRAIQRTRMPPPRPVRPFVSVGIDRTLCDGPLSKSGFITGAPDGFGIFERWILRLGYFTKRVRDKEAFRHDLLVLPYPRLQVPTPFQQGLVDYVAGGGRLLVLDGPENTGSTANRVLEPFGIRLLREVTQRGPLTTPSGWPADVSVENACEVTGGEAIMWINGRPVAAHVRHGRGSVTVVGFGSRFSDAQMGVTGDVQPDPALRRVFDLEFALVRWIIEGRTAARSASMPATTQAERK